MSANRTTDGLTRYRCLRIGAREFAGVGAILEAARGEHPGEWQVYGVVADGQVGAGAAEAVCRIRVTESGAIEIHDLEPVPWES